MGTYIPSTKKEQEELLAEIGVSSLENLYDVVPQDLLLKELSIPVGKAELEVRKIMTSFSQKNQIFSSIFRGAGAYHHYIPALVKQITSKEEFVTSYTPYQAEISQGTLQAIFEYQTMMCEITGLDVANASVYDGASGAAEAVAMCKDRKRNKVLISMGADPMTISTIRTYCFASNTPVELIPLKDGSTDLKVMAEMIDESTSGVFIQQPNYYGVIEEAKEAGDIIHEKGAKYIIGVNPVAMGILETPAEAGADVAVGDAQPFGMPLSFGGPYLGFMTATQEMARKLPGRIVGETTDVDGKRAFVLTLQAREQHIRREKASSNVCSNQALCALTATAYLTAMGPQGLVDVAEQCYAKAHYTAQEICKIDGFKLKYPQEFFHEFVTTSPIESQELNRRLAKKGILGGYPVEGGILWCVTEMNSKEDIDQLVAALKEVSHP